MPDTSNRRKSHPRIEIIKYVSSALIIGLAVAAYFVLGSLAEKPETKASNALIPQVSTETVTPYYGTLDLIIPGSVKAHREIKISAEVVGKIVTKHPEFQAGNFVLAGTPLAEIDAKDYEADQKTLAADVQQAQKRIIENQKQIEGEKRNVELAKQDFAIQKRDFGRIERLADSLSRSEVDQARRALNAAQTNLTSRENALTLLEAGTIRLQSSLQMTESQLEKAKLNLGRVSIVAPTDGVIVSEMVQENDYVSPGSPIAMFEDVSIAEVVCNLTTTELNWIRKNSKPTSKKDDPVDPRMLAYQLPKTEVTIFESEDTEAIWKGTLERFDGIGRDQTTKTIPARIIVPNPITKTPFGPRALVRNMYVKCRVEVETSSSDSSQNLLAISEMALHPGNYVWTVANKKLKRAKVEIVDRTSRKVGDSTIGLVIVRAVNESLSPDDEVVVTPLSQPTDGAVVDIAKEKKRTVKLDADDEETDGETDSKVDAQNGARNDVQTDAQKGVDQNAGEKTAATAGDAADSDLLPADAEGESTPVVTSSEAKL